MRGIRLLDAYVVATLGTWKDNAKGASDLTASICADCGFTEFYATNPTAVWEEWRKQNA